MCLKGKAASSVKGLAALLFMGTAKLLVFHRRDAENAEETWNLCELHVSAVRKANNTQ